jgi:hypothetical protein
LPPNSILLSLAKVYKKRGEINENFQLSVIPREFLGNSRIFNNSRNSNGFQGNFGIISWNSKEFQKSIRNSKEF